MPNTAVFLPAMLPPVFRLPARQFATAWICSSLRGGLLARRDRDLVDDICRAGHFLRLGLDSGFLFSGSDRSFEGDLPPNGDDLHVVRIGRERLVVDNRPPDLPRELEIGLVVRLLVGRLRRRRAVLLVDLGV